MTARHPYPDDEFAGFGGDEAAGFGDDFPAVDDGEPREVYDDSEAAGFGEEEASRPVEGGEDNLDGGPTVTDSEWGTVIDYSTSTSTSTDSSSSTETQWSGEDDVVEKPEDKVVVSGDEIKKLQDMVVYRFWLRELNTLDLQDITAQAQINNMTESEYLARNGEVLWNLYFIQAVPRAETIADYSSYINTPSSNRDPKGELRLFDYWYTLDEFGNRVRLNLTDPTSNILDDKTTTVNVYAAWKDGTVGSDEEEDVDHEDLVDKNPVPVDLTAKASASYEDEEGNPKTTTLPVEVKNLPSAAHSLSVIHMGDDDMERFYESHSNDFGSMAPILGLKISPKNAKGEKVQPAKGEKATVTVSGLNALPEMEGATADTLKVLHQTADGSVETLDVLSYQNGTLAFETASFSPFVVVRTNGYAVDTMLRDQTVKVGRSIAIRGAKGTNGYSHSWAMESGGTGIVALANTDARTVTVVGVKSGKVTLKHIYYTSSYVLGEGYVTSKTDESVTVTIDASSVSNKTTFNPSIKNATVAYIHYTAAQGNSKDFVDNYASLTVVNAGTLEDVDYTTAFNVSYDSRVANYWVFFVKPYDNYLITGIGATGNHDIYDISATSYGNIESYPGIHDLAKNLGTGYIGIFGYSRAANDTLESASFAVEGKSPDMKVAAVSNKTKDVTQGEPLEFTVSIEPGVIEGTTDSKGNINYNHSATVTGVEITGLRINGVTITDYDPPVYNQDTKKWETKVRYKTTAEDCEKGSVTLTVDAKVDYQVVMGVSNNQNITTKASINKSASAECLIAEKKMVEYIPLYDSSVAVPPQGLKDINNVDDGIYTPGALVTVKNDPLYKGKTYDDLVNGGVWTFDGWYLDQELNQKADTTVEMPIGGLKLYGKWTFEKTLSSLTVAKKVTGMMGDTNKEFEFMLYVPKNTVTTNIVFEKNGETGYLNDLKPTGGTNNEYTLNGTWYWGYEFKLKHGESITFENLPTGEYFVLEKTVENYTTTYKTGLLDKINPNSDGKAEVVLTISPLTVTVVNHCGLLPDTGVLLDTLPYIVILAVVAGGVALLMLRKHRKEDD